MNKTAAPVFIFLAALLISSCGHDIIVNVNSSSGNAGGSSSSAGGALSISITYPINESGIYDRNVTISYTTNPVYTSYQIELFTNQSLSVSSRITQETVVFNNYEATSLPYGKIYIKLTPLPGGGPVFSKFTVLMLPATTFWSPAQSSIQYNRLSFSWDTVAGADGYRLYLDNAPLASVNGSSFTLATNIAAYGTHTCFVVTTNQFQQSVTATNSFTLSNKAPVVVLSNNSAYMTNSAIVISAAGSYDNEGDALQFNWNNSGYAPSAVFNTNIAAVGVSVILLSAQDSFGNVVSTNVSLNIVAASIPDPAFTIMPSSGNKSTSFGFDASGTTDLITPAVLINVKWNWGDGAADTAWTTVKTANHTFTNKGGFTVTLTASNTNGFINSVAHSVTVTNRAPSASFTMPASVSTNQVFVVNASGSSDPDGDALQYRWNFGSGFTAWQPSNAYSHSYQYAGTNTVTLEVMDGEGMVGGTQNNIVAAVTFAWTNLSTSGFPGSIGVPSMAFNNGMPYMAFNDGTKSSKATVMMFTNNSWTSVGSAGFTANSVNFPIITFYNGVPYLAFNDSAYSQKASVMIFTNGSWQYLGSPGFSGGTANWLDFEFYNGMPYVSYQDFANQTYISVMTFSNNCWTNLGNPGFSAEFGDYNSLKFNNGVPYVAYRAGTSSVSVKYFAGGAWSNLGNPDFISGGTHIDLAFNNNMPYVAFRGGSGKAVVMNYTNGNWAYVGSQTNLPGDVYFTRLAFIGGTPYLAFQDGFGGPVSVMKFENDVWQYVGSPDFSSGTADWVNLAMDNGVPYVGFQASSSGSIGIVMKYE